MQADTACDMQECKKHDGESLLKFAVLSALLVLVVGFPRSSTATILFADDFERPGWSPATAGWNGGPSIPNFQVTTTNPFSGAHSAQADLNANMFVRGLKRLGIDQSELYVRWFTYYGAGFQCPSQDELGSLAGLVFNSFASAPSATWALASAAQRNDTGSLTTGDSRGWKGIVLPLAAQARNCLH